MARPDFIKTKVHCSQKIKLAFMGRWFGLLRRRGAAVPDAEQYLSITDISPRRCGIEMVGAGRGASS